MGAGVILFDFDRCSGWINGIARYGYLLMRSDQDLILRPNHGKRCRGVVYRTNGVGIGGHFELFAHYNCEVI